MSTAFAAERPAEGKETTDVEPFRFCFNTSTIRGQNLGLGTRSISSPVPAIRELSRGFAKLDEYVKQGGALADLRKAHRKSRTDCGEHDRLFRVDRRRTMPVAPRHSRKRRNMELVAAIGGSRLA